MSGFMKSRTWWWPLEPPGKKKQGAEPPLPAPAPEPTVLKETEEAKGRARGQAGRRKGRPSTVLAGRLMSERGKMLLGE